jgi:hypothetical protein
MLLLEACPSRLIRKGVSIRLSTTEPALTANLIVSEKFIMSIFR